jgi:class I lanthipeptide synthase
LIRPGRTAVTFAERFGAPGLTRLWTEAPQPRAYGDVVLSDAGRAPAHVDHDTAILGLLHMQHNRLLGIDRAREYRGHAILLGTARDHLGRAAHAGGGRRDEAADRGGPRG